MRAGDKRISNIKAELKILVARLSRGESRGLGKGLQAATEGRLRCSRRERDSAAQVKGTKLQTQKPEHTCTEEL